MGWWGRGFPTHAIAYLHYLVQSSILNREKRKRRKNKTKKGKRKQSKPDECGWSKPFTLFGLFVTLVIKSAMLLAKAEKKGTTNKKEDKDQ